MKVAKAKGRLRGKQPNSSQRRKRTSSNSGEPESNTSAELAELFSVARSTVYRAVQRAGEPKPARDRRA